MTPVADNWTIVVIGCWNTRLIGIPWISRNLFGGAEVTGEFPVTPGYPPRYSAGRIQILPTEDRLVFRVQEATDQALGELETKAVQTLELLAHTPVQAVGLNLGFREANPFPELAALFERADLGKVLQAGYELKGAGFMYSLERAGGLMNLALTRSEAGIDLAVNYDWRVETAVAAAECIRSRALTLKTEALDLIQKAYGLALEEEA